MTGGRVWGEVNQNFTNTFTNNAGRGPYMWINWPCTDNSKSHLIMGGYTTFLHPGVDPAKIQGIVLNPMQQSEPSKVAIFRKCMLFMEYLGKCRYSKQGMAGFFQICRPQFSSGNGSLYSVV